MQNDIERKNKDMKSGSYQPEIPELADL